MMQQTLLYNPLSGEHEAILRVGVLWVKVGFLMQPPILQALQSWQLSAAVLPELQSTKGGVLLSTVLGLMPARQRLRWNDNSAGGGSSAVPVLVLQLPMLLLTLRSAVLFVLLSPVLLILLVLVLQVSLCQLMIVVLVFAARRQSRT
jgi:hypothetical protein